MTMKGAIVSPEKKDENPYNLPTGEELMNRPIDDPALSLKEKELLFVSQNVAERLGHLTFNGKHLLSNFREFLLLFI